MGGANIFEKKTGMLKLLHGASVFQRMQFNRFQPLPLLATHSNAFPRSVNTRSPTQPIRSQPFHLVHLEITTNTDPHATPILTGSIYRHSMVPPGLEDGQEHSTVSTYAHRVSLNGYFIRGEHGGGRFSTRVTYTLGA